MSTFKDRAEDEAARRDREDSDWYARQADLLFVDGAIWATHQPPTDAEVEAACRAFYEATNPHLDPSMQLSWDRLIAGSPDVAENYRRALMPALLAAQKVRVGQ